MDGIALSVGVVSITGIGAVQNNVDTYTTSTAQDLGLPDGAPITFINVDRGLQPAAMALYNVQP